jgi:hypothetical protein
VLIAYQDQGVTEIFSSENSIDGVCYQVSKATPVTPNSEEEIEEK